MRTNNVKSIAELLKLNFPWLGTDDESDIPYPGGADTVQDLETFYRIMVDTPAADPLLSLRNAAGAVLHELTRGEASEGDVREIKTCARLLTAALAGKVKPAGRRKPAPSLRIAGNRITCPHCKQRGTPRLVEAGYIITHELKTITRRGITASGWDGSSEDVSESGTKVFLECEHCCAEIALPEGMGVDWV